MQTDLPPLKLLRLQWLVPPVSERQVPSAIDFRAVILENFSTIDFIPKSLFGEAANTYDGDGQCPLEFRAVFCV